MKRSEIFVLWVRSRQAHDRAKKEG